ncbi:hypothetical protein GJ744_007365 [Endocarpon pusillum]|uniref:FAM192A/Fyv6 N-terminal domain-containing protein n=1 Tax=Endocarpon pusillum TaxID=364733 RepID=A0A8H7AM13_9EURO|nr:hypothetical protein GJ744_007365 [Endocarpon pusillum]
MSSGFVSAGSDGTQSRNDDEWHKARLAIEETRRPRQEANTQEGGKSLYEVLQQNKTAKQEEFEEKNRLKNQFRSLDDDEADFLDSVLESTRAKEAQVRKETAEQLDTFRKQREAAEDVLSGGNAAIEKSDTRDKPLATEESWSASSRKRRRVKQKDDEGSGKLRKKSSTTENPRTKLVGSEGLHTTAPGGGVIETTSSDNIKHGTGSAKSEPADINPSRTSITPAPITPAILGLGAYSSDDD